jgi:hypothetical protein
VAPLSTAPEVVTELRLNVEPRPIICTVLRFPDGQVRARLGDERGGRILTGEQILAFRAMLADVLAAIFTAGLAERRKA